MTPPFELRIPAMIGASFGFVLLASVLYRSYALWGLLTAQSLFLVCVLAFAASSTQGLGRRLGLEPSGLGSLLASVPMAVGFAVLVQAWLKSQTLVFPLPDALVQQYETLLAQCQVQPVLAVLCIVVAPALVEECLFRGVILRGLLPLVGSRLAVGLSALLFGLFHLDPYKLVSSLALGLALGALALASKSIYPAMLLHGAYNACLLFIGDAIIELAEQPVALLLSVLLIAPGWWYVCPRSRGGENID